jgi:hypothetical protein
MPELEADTHGMIVTGTVSAAGDNSIGSITLPASGPWTVYGFWSMVANATPTAAEAITGNAFFRASQGDLDPNPAPVRFPIVESPSTLGAVIDVQPIPLVIHDINYSAPGKSTIEFFITLDTALTVAAQVVMGLIFGKTVPEKKPMQFCDRVTVGITSATETSIGTITLAEKATLITGVCGMLTTDLVVVTLEELLGFFRLDSADVKMTPAQFPFSACYGAGLGATIANPGGQKPIFIPVHIPVKNGARIDAFVDLNTAVTNAARAQVFLCYE